MDMDDHMVVAEKARGWRNVNTPDETIRRLRQGLDQVISENNAQAFRIRELEVLLNRELRRNLEWTVENTNRKVGIDGE